MAVTGNAHYREPFEPLPGIVKFAEYNHLESVESLVNDKTCAILMETIQGEGGIYPAQKEFLAGVKKICKEHDILLILDEIQCGMGRCGQMFAWQHYGVKPDIMACAKAIGGGVPVGAFFLTEDVAKQSLAPGDHGSTYGGNPLVGAAVDKVFEIFERDQICEHAKKMGLYLEKTLEALVQEFDCVKGRRGLGLMQGLIMDIPVGDVVKAAQEQGLLVITAGKDVVRMLPPLIIERSHVDEMAVKLKAAIKSCM